MSTLLAHVHRSLGRITSPVQGKDRKQNFVMHSNQTFIGLGKLKSGGPPLLFPAEI